MDGRAGESVLPAKQIAEIVSKKKRGTSFQQKDGGVFAGQGIFQGNLKLPSFWVHLLTWLCHDSALPQSQPWLWCGSLAKAGIKSYSKLIYPWWILVPDSGLCRFAFPLLQMTITLYVTKENLWLSHLDLYWWFIVTVCLYCLFWNHRLLPGRAIQSHSPC